MYCPANPGKANSTGRDIPYNEFYMVPELRDLSYQIIEKYKGKVPCPNYKLIIYWVKKHIRYITDRAQFGVVDFWLFPNETLETGMEDCDGLSFLVASLLEGAGYPTRVCLGPTPFGYHAWVEFNDDDGELLVVEATMGIIYHYNESLKLGYMPDIYVNPYGCSLPYDIESY